jgi:hypothetical protein
MKASARGKHQNGWWILALPHFSQDRQAISIGQTKVENHSGVTGCHHRGESIGRCRQKIGFITRRLHTQAQKLRQLLVVLNQ